MILKHEKYSANMFFQDFLKKWQFSPRVKSLTATATEFHQSLGSPSPRHVRESKRISKLLAVWIRTASVERPLPSENGTSNLDCCEYDD